MSATPAGGAAIDRMTQGWVITTGREIDLRDQPWLDGPVGSPGGTGERWIDDHARRLRRLALPLDPLDTAYGMTSRVVTFTADDGTHLGTAWQRALRATGATVFGGSYGLGHLPGARRASIRVVFPLPDGSVTVLLRPDHRAAGSLRLLSSPGPFGAEGAYLIVRAPDRTHGWAGRVPLPERFDVAVDDTGTLRCGQRLWLTSPPVLQLHYRLQRPRR